MAMPAVNVSKQPGASTHTDTECMPVWWESCLFGGGSSPLALLARMCALGNNKRVCRILRLVGCTGPSCNATAIACKDSVAHRPTRVRLHATSVRLRHASRSALLSPSSSGLLLLLPSPRLGCLPEVACDFHSGAGAVAVLRRRTSQFAVLPRRGGGSQSVPSGGELAWL